jgi:hypothetical protein
MNMTSQRTRVKVLAYSFPSFTLVALLFAQRLQDSRWLHVFIGAYALVMATLLAYTVTQMMKLKRSRR